MKKITSLFLFCVTLILISCSKNDNPVSPNLDNSSDGSNLMPLKKGAWFKFNHKISSSNIEVKKTITGEKEINGQVYAVLTPDVQASPDYIREENNSLFALAYDPDSKAYTEYKIADFFMSTPGDTWIQERMYKGTLNRNKYTFMGDNYKFIMKGQEYKALKIRIDTYAVSQGQEFYGTTQYTMFVKGLGIVFNDLGSYGVIQLVDYGQDIE